MVGLIVKATDPALLATTKKATSAAASPFVLAIERAQIKVLPDIINAAILLFVLSAANSDLVSDKSICPKPLDSTITRPYRDSTSERALCTVSPTKVKLPASSCASTAWDAPTCAPLSALSFPASGASLATFSWGKKDEEAS